jgi:hypothetical protein
MLISKDFLSNYEFVVVAGLRRASSLEGVKVPAMVTEPIPDKEQLWKATTSHILENRAFPTCQTSKIACLDVIMA